MTAKERPTDSTALELAAFVPKEVGKLTHVQTDLPRIACEPKLTTLIEAVLRDVPTTQRA